MYKKYPAYKFMVSGEETWKFGRKQSETKRKQSETMGKLKQIQIEFGKNEQTKHKQTIICLFSASTSTTAIEGEANFCERSFKLKKNYWFSSGRWRE